MPVVTRQSPGGVGGCGAETTVVVWRWWEEGTGNWATYSTERGGAWDRVRLGHSGGQHGGQELPRPLCEAPNPPKRFWAPLLGGDLGCSLHWWGGDGLWGRGGGGGLVADLVGLREQNWGGI